MAALEPVLVDLTGLVEGPGDSHPLSGHLDLTAYEVGQKEFSVPGGVDYDVVFTNAGEGILVTGLVRARAEGECDRCLDPASFEVAGEIEEYYLFAEPDDPDAYEDGFEVIGEDRVIDLAAPLFDALVIDTPFVVLCQPDCLGLCPTCGANLNRETCDCAARASQEWKSSADNPFSVLSQLTFDD